MAALHPAGGTGEGERSLSPLVGKRVPGVVRSRRAMTNDCACPCVVRLHCGASTLCCTHPMEGRDALCSTVHACFARLVTDQWQGTLFLVPQE